MYPVVGACFGCVHRQASNTFQMAADIAVDDGGEPFGFVFILGFGDVIV
jgi:hypothetical protein